MEKTAAVKVQLYGLPPLYKSHIIPRPDLLQCRATDYVAVFGDIYSILLSRDMSRDIAKDHGLNIPTELWLLLKCIEGYTYSD